MRIFISHNRNDKKTARELARMLRAQGSDVWFDEWEIIPGQSIIEALEHGLSLADSFVIIWSKNAKESSWVSTEWRSYLRRRIDDRTLRIIPIRIDNTPLPSVLREYSGFRLSEESTIRNIALSILQEGPTFRIETDKVQVLLDILRADGTRARYHKKHTLVCVSGTITEYVDAYGVMLSGARVGDFEVSPGRIGRSWVDRDLLRVQHLFPEPLNAGEKITRLSSCTYFDRFLITPGYFIQRTYYPSKGLFMNVRFPIDRPPQHWWAEEIVGDRRRRLRTRRFTLQKKPAIGVLVPKPILLADYVLNWKW